MDYTEGEAGLEDLIRIMIQGELEGLYGPLPAKVHSYDKTRQAVDVDPIALVVLDGTPKALPRIKGIPVRWLSAKSFALTAPLIKGDLGWVIPAGVDISGYLARGQENAQPVHHQKFSLADLIYVPGGRPLASPLPTDAVDDQAAVLYVQTMLKLGDATAQEKVALAGKLKTELDAIALHTHNYVSPGGPAVTDPSNYTAPATADAIGATKVKAK